MKPGEKDMQALALRQQTKVLAACYLTFVACDILMMTLGDILLSNKVDYECDDTNEITRNIL
jgi:hypothetical protein